ncbi:UDP-N-acetylglucosamine 2-epimerase (non-hydrolyzing) [bacterium]|nr:UDP-N-acetylglucosamine 2-epimerase (non-hydrolyzing) [bacterium]
MARKVLCVVGTRPNLVKVAAVLRAFAAQAAAGTGRLTPVLVDTGQHYDEALSGRFYADLHLPPPDYRLGVGSGSHAATTAAVIRGLEPVLLAERPDLVLVFGDVNSTVAAALTAAKTGVRLAHVEAGLRCFDRRVPEEVNRVVTDALAELLFVTEAAAVDNLRREGREATDIHLVGNVMIDSLLWALPQAGSSRVLERLGLAGDRDLAILTVHRAGNVDAPAPLAAILGAAAELAGELPVILPVHPRTRARIREWGLSGFVCEPGAPPRSRVLVSEPLGYLDFVHLLARARLVLTDSGGVQDETTVLGTPCLVLRDHSERPVTLTTGTSVLVGRDRQRILAGAHAALRRAGVGERPPPPLWDGRAGERIARVLAEHL